MRRLISIGVNYMLGNRNISYAIIQGTLSVFPCGRTQHVRRMRSSIVRNDTIRLRVQIHACDTTLSS